MPARTDIEPTAGRGAAGRVPPHDLQAEESLLGAMMLSAGAIADAAGAVGSSDFYKPAHGHVYDAIHTLYATGQPADAVTVADELRRAGLLEAIGGPSVLAQILSATPATTNAARYARIVEEYALLRRLIGVAGEIAELGYSVPEDVQKALDRAESLVYEVNERRVTDTMKLLSSLLSENLDRIEQLHEKGDAVTGTPTGYFDLDHLLSGLQPSSLVVVGARPAMGKTSFALGMLAHAALDAPNPLPSPVLLARDEPPRAVAATPLLGGQGRLAPPPQRAAQGRGLEQHLQGDGSPGPGTDLDRRQPQPHDHGDPGQGPPAEEPGRQARDDRHRLPPADDGPVQRREPPGGGQRAQPRAQDPREGARDPGRRPQPAQPQPRDASRQAPHAGRPSRIGLASSRTRTS